MSGLLPDFFRSNISDSRIKCEARLVWRMERLRIARPTAQTAGEGVAFILSAEQEPVSLGIYRHSNSLVYLPVRRCRRLCESPKQTFTPVAAELDAATVLCPCFR
jgi:hypothetical protein